MPIYIYYLFIYYYYFECAHASNPVTGNFYTKTAVHQTKNKLFYPKLFLPVHLGSLQIYQKCYLLNVLIVV